MMAVSNLDDFQALGPFFRIIEEGVAGLVDGEHFFDLLAEEVVFEYIITVPGYPRRVAGRQAVAELYRPYGTTIVLDRCYDLPFITTRSPELSFSSTPRRAGSLRPGLPTATATSRCYPSSSARSLTGATTSIRSRSLTRSDGPRGRRQRLTRRAGSGFDHQPNVGPPRIATTPRRTARLFHSLLCLALLIRSNRARCDPLETPVGQRVPHSS
jgi:hypothetical protein